MSSASQPLGAPVPGFVPPIRPVDLTLSGRFVRVEPLDRTRHGAALFAAYDGHDALWTYMPNGPFLKEADFRAFLDALDGSTDPVFVAFCTPGGEAIGMGSYLRIVPEAGSIEIGHLCFSPRLQATPAATEAMMLMMQWAFGAGYRRLEWKCNALNMASRRAAQRLGLSFEGVFRQAAIVKGRNRDTAWFAAIDAEWPDLYRAFRSWLDPVNFRADGSQIRRLSDLTRPLLHARDPALTGA